MTTETARLRFHRLPIFSSLQELAVLIDIESVKLEKFSDFAERFYKTYYIPKKNGKFRTINQPSGELKNVQRWILKNILEKIYPSEYATAYIKGKTLSSNVNPHCYNHFFLSLDINNFFNSIKQFRIEKFFRLLGYSKESANILSDLCTFFGKLPQGGATSPALSNIVCHKFDIRLAGLSDRHNIVYTRYADDLTFSCKNRKSLYKIFPTIEKIVKSEGFSLNKTKTRFLGPNNQCRITGLVKDSSNQRFSIGRQKKIEMRAIMHHFVTGRVMDNSFNTEESITGWLNFIKGVDKKSYHQMLDYWNKLKEKYVI